MRYLLTGHTGFKGAWLSLLLHRRGHEVTGLSLDPAPGSLYQRARVGEVLAQDLRLDIREPAAVRDAVREVAPDVVIHLAAQPLVRESYRAPRYTVETNVMGTYNVLDAVQAAGGVRAHVVVTTDKVYRNVGQVLGYREGDALGGVDPYSASKAAADLLAQSWTVSTGAVVPTAIARAGNVVGGGDVSGERLLVDLLSSFQAGRPAVLRNPDAIRPWQHVLDCLHGYLLLVDALLAGRAHGEAFNFGPPTASCVPVGTVTSRVADLWGDGATWQIAPDDAGLHEAGLLTLDAGRAERDLGWRSLLDLEETLRWTVAWTRRTTAGEDPQAVALAQIDSFEARTGGLR